MAEFDPKSIETVTSSRITSRVEQKFEKGDNHFITRSLLASAALLLMKQERDIIADANERIIRLLANRGAEAEVYAVETDLGNGLEHSTDFVRIIARGGVETDAQRTQLHSAEESYVIRASTADIDY